MESGLNDAGNGGAPPRGARIGPIVAPGAPDLAVPLGAARPVVAAPAPGPVRADAWAAGPIAIDAGYYNPGGRGEFDASGVVARLAAFAPVPGGIGSMTVAMLVERVVEFSERRLDVRD
ncbi:MAG TPA: hypothetical protein VF158_10975 [Longimicrobiales bacterium]